jgi:HD-like signal output (HDOD) protein
MKKVLFVDDDPGVLGGLRRMLHSQRHQWDMTFANGGDAALDLLSASAFDVVVTDMRMPGVDGAELLANLRERHPATVRIILSGHTELAGTLRSVPVAHQFLSKPCEAAVLVQSVERACALEDRLQDPALRRLLGEMSYLPSPSRVVLELNDALGRQDAQLDDIAAIIERDPAMSAKLLQLVNSAFFGLAHSVVRVRDAVTYLGVDIVRSLAVAVGSFQSLPDGPASASWVEQLQHHGLEVARLAQRIAPSEHAQDAFAAGLLHDVGLLALAVSLPEALEELRLASATPEQWDDLELELLGATHAEIGAYLLTLWGIPYGVVEAVANHHRAPALGTTELDAVHATYIADQMLGAAFPQNMACDRRAALDPSYVQALGVVELVEELTLELRP